MKLEDGEIISREDGIYHKCPACKQLVPQVVGTEPENLQPLIDLRDCATGYIDIETGETKTHKQCQTCGMALKDKEGNILFKTE
jgi:predicted RNA-binding Zn-ribbon protein involved in translation (DUF1610 family)